MRSRHAGYRRVRLAWVAVAAAAIASGCGRLPDENWLRVVHIENSEGAVVSSITSVLQTTTTIPATTVTQGIPDDPEIVTTINGPDLVTVVFENRSTIVPGSDPGVGVTLNQVQITYGLSGYAPPGVTLPVTLYIPASTGSSSSSTTTTSVTSLKIPLVSSALKSWLVSNVPAYQRRSGLTASARLVFHAVADGGGDLVTQAGIGIAFVNEAKAGTTTTTTTAGIRRAIR